MTSRQNLAAWLCVVAVVFAGTTAVYWPGLSGPFLLDDGANLAGLQQDEDKAILTELRAYLDTAWAGPTGRPITLASFYLNAPDGFASAWRFKLGNLGLHLINGLLVLAAAALALRLMGMAGSSARWVSLGTAALWLWHPLQVVPVLYVSQRMALLATFFMLLGLVVYLLGRALAGRRPGQGMAVMVVGIAGAGIAAVFSKEIGVLLPLYVLVLELTLLAAVSVPGHSAWRLGRALLLLGPLAVIFVGQSIQGWGDLMKGFQPYAYGVAERLLSEPRVLWDYLGDALMPWRAEARLFHDDFAASTGWLLPWTTLPALLGLVALVAGALIWRRRWPVAAFAVLWFVAGHALEAGPLGLTLHEEYRNYLPLLGPVFAVAYGLVVLAERLRLPAFVLPALPAVLLAFLTLQHARVWGETDALARTWAAQAPASVLSQQYAAQRLLAQGRAAEAREALQTAVSNNGDALGVALQLTGVACQHGMEVTLDPDEVRRRASVAPVDNSIYPSLDAMLPLTANHRCEHFDLNDLHAVLRALLANPHYQGRIHQARLHYDLALLMAVGDRVEDAVGAGAWAMAHGVDQPVAETLAGILVDNGQADKALSYIRRMLAARDRLADGDASAAALAKAMETLRAAITRRMD